MTSTLAPIWISRCQAKRIASEAKGIITTNIAITCHCSPSVASVLVKELENSAVPSIHGLHPVNAESEATLNAMRVGLSRGQLESSTIGSVANEAILQPTLLDIAGRLPALDDC